MVWLSVTPLYEAVIVTLVGAVTGLVVIGKPVPLIPCGRVTVAGTLRTDGLLLLIETTAGLVAGAFSPTKKLSEAPPCSLNAKRFTSMIGWTVRVAVFVEPSKVAEIVTVVSADTGLVLMLNTEESIDPWPMVIDAGTLAIEGSLLDSDTTMPPAGAGPVISTFPETVDPPPTDTEECENSKTC